MYEQHIEGKVDASIRTANRPDENAVHDDFATKSEVDNKAGSKYASIESRGGKSRGGARGVESPKPESSIGCNTDEKYEIPNNAKLEIFKASRVQKLEENYILVAHPYPQMEGELLLF